MKIVLVFLTFLLVSVTFAQDAEHPLEIPDSCVYIPNTITPDCDQVDCEYFTLYFQCPIDDFKLVIYDRFGELVFESQDLENKWSSAEATEDGLYHWVITGIMSDLGTPFAVSKKGTVVVLK